MTKQQTVPNLQASWKKYSTLISLVILFLLLTVGMLLSSIYITKVQNTYAQEILIATRQSRLIQQISKASLDLDLYMEQALKPNNSNLIANNIPENNQDNNDNTVLLAQLPQATLYVLEELKSAKNQFEQNLSAFEKNGTVTISDQQEEYAYINALNRNDEKEKLTELRRSWNPYIGLIDAYISEVSTGKINKQTTDYLVDYAHLYNNKLTNDSIVLNHMIQEDLTATTKFWNAVQITGIVAAIALFIIIVFGALRQLMSNDKKLAIANQEMSEIMSSVNEGLFLIDKNLNIAGQYSDSLEKILNQKHLANKSFIDVLNPLISNDEIETTKTFIEQLYSEWVVIDLIEDLNPLHRITVTDELGNNLKFLEFKFFPVKINNEVERVLVSVIDSTETVMLQASIDAQKEQEGRELEMLNIILNTNPAIMNSFVTDNLARLNNINQTLESPESSKTELRSKIQYIARLVHSIKGEASSLKLHRIVNICETFEDTLKVLRDSSNLKGQDFLGLPVLLEDLYQLFSVLQSYSSRFNSENPNTTQQTKTSAHITQELIHSQEQYLKNFVLDIANRVGKKAELVLTGFDTTKIEATQLSKLKDIAIQLLRNSVVHGIETPEVRMERHKPQIGTLKLSLSAEDDGNILMVAEDDGNGIDFETIRNKIVTLGIASHEEAQKMDQRQLINFIFSSGFSTAKHETEDAGRGVGMDIIKATIQEMGGKIAISTAPKNYTRLKITFPVTK